MIASLGVFGLALMIFAFSYHYYTRVSNTPDSHTYIDKTGNRRLP